MDSCLTSSHFHHEHEQGLGVFWPVPGVIAFALMPAALLASPALTRNLSAGSLGPKSQGALSVTSDFCLNSSGAAPPVKSASVGEHICKTKQCCGLPGGLWLAQWIIHSLALQDLPGHQRSQQERGFIHYQALVCSLQRFPLPHLIAPSGFNKTSHSFKDPLGSRGASHPLFLFPMLKVP